MKSVSIYPELFLAFADRSGRLRTPASRDAFKIVLAQLQSRNPGLKTGRVTTEILTEFCLHGSPAPNTARTRRSVLRSVFEWAEYAGYVESNPASKLKFTVSPGTYKVRQGNWLPEARVAEILRSTPDDFAGRRARIVLMFGFMMGLRRAAISDLRWSQLSPDLRVLTLKVKGNKLTQKGVPEQLREALEAWRREAPADAVAVVPRINIIGFGAREAQVDWSTPMGHKGIAHVIQEAGERCGVKLTPHDMRRSLAGILEAKGVPVTDIQRALDHSNVGTTSIYLDQNPNKSISATGGIRFDL